MIKKMKYIFAIITLLLFPLCNVFAEVTHSYRGKEKNLVYVVGIVLLAVRIIVPIILIVMASIDLVKAMTENDEREMKKVINSIIPKVVAAIIVFLIPSILVLVLRLINQNSLWSEYGSCLTHPINCNVNLWEK